MQLKKAIILVCLSLLIISYESVAQTSIVDPSDSLNRRRLIGVSATLGSAYVISMVGLNYLWYKDYPRSSFHFFNDNKEWNQVDKAGHMTTAYFESLWCMKALQWAGVEQRKAAFYGASIGFIAQTSIELLDGYSSKWGASGGDILANGLGSLTMLSQELLWAKQKISLKYSMHAVDYPSGIYSDRASDLYGESFVEKMLKDYNGQVYWISFNTASFIEKQSKFKWFNIALGYGGGNMYGGFKNSSTDSEGNIIIYPVERYRKFLLSVDADLTKIPVKHKGWKPVLYILNVFKMPAPAIEFNTKGEIIFHPMYFLNFDIPIQIKD